MASIVEMFVLKKFYLFNIFLTSLFSIHFITRGIYTRFAIKLILGHIRRNDEFIFAIIKVVYISTRRSRFVLRYKVIRVYIYIRVYLLRQRHFESEFRTSNFSRPKETKSSIKLLLDVYSLSRVAF